MSVVNLPLIEAWWKGQKPVVFLFTLLGLTFILVPVVVLRILIHSKQYPLQWVGYKRISFQEIRRELREGLLMGIALLSFVSYIEVGGKLWVFLMGVFLPLSAWFLQSVYLILSLFSWLSVWTFFFFSKLSVKGEVVNDSVIYLIFLNSFILFSVSFMKNFWRKDGV